LLDLRRSRGDRKRDPIEREYACEEKVKERGDMIAPGRLVWRVHAIQKREGWGKEEREEGED
jgi:hypothetical protein